MIIPALPIAAAYLTILAIVVLSLARRRSIRKADVIVGAIIALIAMSLYTIGILWGPQP